MEMTLGRLTASLVESNRLMSELLTRQKGIETRLIQLEAKFQELGRDVQALWFAPGMPGYVETTSGFAQKIIDLTK